MSIKRSWSTSQPVTGRPPARCAVAAGTAALLVALSLAAGPARALDLVSEDEAHRPDAEAVGLTRGITRGPAIQLVTPESDTGSIKGPFKMVVNFKARGGSQIDPRSIEVLYLKQPPVDLTQRLAAGIRPEGIDLDGLALPPGQHRLLVRVADQEGRSSDLVVQIKVEP
ncbi:MAG: hypothetical protein RIQ60_1803 [Pseudomonadota bacterium]|jgi:hypothetical protein